MERESWSRAIQRGLYSARNVSGNETRDISELVIVFSRLSNPPGRWGRAMAVCSQP